MHLKESILNKINSYSDPFPHWELDSPLSEKLIDELQNIKISDAPRAFDGTRAADAGGADLDGKLRVFLEKDNSNLLPNGMELINDFKVFISMDSANMHLASLTSAKVVSIWGPTHPFLGFSPLFNKQFIVQLSDEEYSERPVSIYGEIKKNDKVKAEQSMLRIDPKRVIEKINLAINQ